MLVPFLHRRPAVVPVDAGSLIRTSAAVGAPVYGDLTDISRLCLPFPGLLHAEGPSVPAEIGIGLLVVSHVFHTAYVVSVLPRPADLVVCRLYERSLTVFLREDVVLLALIAGVGDDVLILEGKAFLNVPQEMG